MEGADRAPTLRFSKYGISQSVESRQYCRDVVDCMQNPSLDHSSRRKVILVALVDARELDGYLRSKYVSEAIQAAVKTT